MIFNFCWFLLKKQFFCQFAWASKFSTFILSRIGISNNPGSGNFPYDEYPHFFRFSRTKTIKWFNLNLTWSFQSRMKFKWLFFWNSDYEILELELFTWKFFYCSKILFWKLMFLLNSSIFILVAFWKSTFLIWKRTRV